jgi:hypothetical protein
MNQAQPVIKKRLRLKPELLLRYEKLLLVLWFVPSIFIAIQHVREGSVNNFVIFRNVFYHLLHGQNLYGSYAEQLGDYNLYGPFFGIVIAPFALLPISIGAIAWVIANAGFLLFAVRKLPLTRVAQNLLLLLCANELMINFGQMQSNALTCACILLAFSYVQKEKENKALFFICFGAFIKIYALAGLVFFLFSKNKTRFIAWGLIWSLLFFAAPMLLSNPHFVCRSYMNWFEALSSKTDRNNAGIGNALYQNISAMGFFSRVFGAGWQTPVFITGILLFISQICRPRFYNQIGFRYFLLASVLLFTVLFSNGSESCTYIIGVMGMSIWFVVQNPSKPLLWFFIVAWVFTTFIYSDLMGGSWARHHLVRPYSLKAVSPLVVWLVILIQIHLRKFQNINWSAVCLAENKTPLATAPTLNKA